MKRIRKIAGKVTALAVAITTTVALLSPYDANAQSGSRGAGSGGLICGFQSSKFECGTTTTKTTSGGGGGWFGGWGSFGGNGGGSSTTVTTSNYVLVCNLAGSMRACTQELCSGGSITKACNPDCTVSIY